MHVQSAGGHGHEHMTHKLRSLTTSQKVFVVAAAVAVAAVATFALIALGTVQALSVGTLMGGGTALTLSEYFHTRSIYHKKPQKAPSLVNN